METVEGPKKLKFAPADALADFGDEAQNAQVGPMIGIAAIALSMAMKYHDIATIQDGTLYQQYKLEGRNMVPLHMDMVFETAMQIEAHLVAANKRVAQLLVATALAENDEDETEEEAVVTAEEERQTTPSE